MKFVQFTFKGSCVITEAEYLLAMSQIVVKNTGYLFIPLAGVSHELEVMIIKNINLFLCKKD